MRIKDSTLTALKTYGVTLAVVVSLFWFVLVMAKELLKHQQQTLDFLAGIDTVRPWLFLLRLSLYTTTYAGWRFLLTTLRPSISEAQISDGRKILIRLFIVYELFFGINIISWITR